MLVFLYGADTFRSREKLHTIVDLYKSKHDLADFKVFYPGDKRDEESSAGHMKNFLFSSSLFVEKKLAVMHDVIGSVGEKEIIALLDQEFLSLDQNVVVIIQDSCQKIPAAWKFLLERAEKKQEFKILTPAQIRGWATSSAQQKGIVFEDSALRALTQKYAEDTWSLSNEIEKISLLGKDLVSLRDVESISQIYEERAIFALLDALWSKSMGRMALLEEALSNKVDSAMIFNMIVSQSGIVSRIVAGQQTGIKAHPFVIKKLSGFAARFTFSRIAVFHATLADYDQKIKSGFLDFEDALTNIMLLKI